MTASVLIRFIWKEAILLPILTAIHERGAGKLALDRSACAWRLPRREPRNGLAFGVGVAGEAAQGGAASHPSPRAGALDFCRSDRSAGGGARSGPSDFSSAHCRGYCSDRLWPVSPPSGAASALGGNAGRFS